MTSDIDDTDDIETLSSLNGDESPHHREHKLKRGMKRKSDAASNNTQDTTSLGRETLAEQGHDWNEKFGFKVERPAKVEYAWLQEKINVANALLFSLTPAASQLICKGRSYKEVIEIFVRRAGKLMGTVMLLLR